MPTARRHVFAGAPGPQRHHAAHRPLALPQAVPQPGAACRRGLHGRAHALRGLDAARLPHAVLAQPALARHQPAAEGAAAHLARPQALPAGEPGRQGAAATSRTTTTSATTSTSSSSTRACSTPAPTSSTTATRLEEAQRNKLRLIAAKLDLEARPQDPRHRQRLGRPRALSRDASRRSTSPASRCPRSSTRCRTRRRSAPGSPTGCASSCRTIARSTGRFDRIVSVGMFEHVGVHHYGEFFAKVNELMSGRRRSCCCTPSAT